jgi:hypothetical protein
MLPPSNLLVLDGVAVRSCLTSALFKASSAR